MALKPNDWKASAVFSGDFINIQLIMIENRQADQSAATHADKRHEQGLDYGHNFVKPSAMRTPLELSVRY